MPITRDEVAHLARLSRIALSDVQAVISDGPVTNVPPWFQITATLPAASSADPAWGVTLTPGRYALVCVLERSSALYALTEVTIG